jgi:gliding motility-associated-like protein
MKKYSLLILLFFALKSFSQKEANIWYFGENAGLDFNTTPPTALTNGNLNTLEGCSSFSDADGNLLFYSDGITVYDKNHDIMKYSDGSLADNLKGDPSSTQSGMIIPKPDSSSIYYLFTVDDGPEYDRSGNNIIEDGKGFNYYTIDMSIGNGEVVEGPVDLSDGKFNSWTEKVAAVKGKVCNTYWVVSAVENRFYAYQVNNIAVSKTPIISIVPNSASRRGYLKISPDGTKIAIANQNSTANNSVFLYDFNNETGKVSSTSIKLIDGVFDGTGQAYGLEFSSDSKKLYVSTTSGFRATIFYPIAYPAETYKLFQFDLESTNIKGSRELIHQQIGNSLEYPEGGFRGALQLGPNGKIYATIPSAYNDGFAPFLDVIENPNASASDVIFTKNAIDLKGRFATQGLPPFIASLLLPIKISDEDTGLQTNNTDLKTCIGSTKVIAPEAITGITDDTYIWTFDNGTTVTEISNSPTQKSLNLTNIQTAKEGTYKLKIEGKDVCGNKAQYNASFNLKVFEAASAKPIPDPIYFCDSDATVPNVFNFQKSSKSNKSKEILDGLSDTIFEVLYFDDFKKADDNVAGTNLPDNYEVNTPDEQTIYARVHNMSVPNTCYEITSFKLTVTGLPVATDPGPYPACDTDISGPNFGYHDAFRLDSKDDAILGGSGGLDPTLYNISYHTTALGARTPDSTTIIPKDIPYRNDSINKQKIFIRLENKADPACFDASMSFFLIVDPLPIIKNNMVTLDQCITISDPNPTTVNLTLSEVNISNTPNLTFEYYEDPTGTTLITTPTSYPVIANISQSVYVKVISDQGCSKDMVTLTINVGRTLDNPFNTLQPPVCDDFLDADGNNSDTDFITNFSLDSISIVNNINPPPNTRVFFYENQKDRTDALNDIYITKYRNNISKIDTTHVTEGIQFPIYYKILSTINNNCQGLGQFNLQINKVPSFFVMGEENIDDPRIVCLNDTPLVLEAENPGAIYAYQWTNKSGVNLGINATQGVTTAGNYTVTATDKFNGCSRSRTIVVEESEVATLEESFITIIDEANNIGNTNTISVSIDTIRNNLGPGAYQYALRNEDTSIRYPFSGFQDTPVFENLEGGIYTIIVNDKNGCVPDAKLPISVIQYPKFFTPNGDGKNDTWSIKGANKSFYPNSSIDIYNRFGKLVAQIPIDSQGWDGTYNGTRLPSDDYWFRVQLIPANTNKNPILKKGHFSLLRR